MEEFIHVCASDYCAELPGILVVHACCQPTKGIEMELSLIVFRGKGINREHQNVLSCICHAARFAQNQERLEQH